MSHCNESETPIEGEVVQAAESAQEAAPAPPAPYVKREVTVSGDTSPAGLLAVAVARGANIAELSALMDLKERYEATEARKAYTEAMARFKSNAPMIFKDKNVSYENKDGTTTGYSHATLGNVANVIASSLGEYGLSHGWQIVSQDVAFIKVRCTVTHALGHSEYAELGAGADGSGGKNAIQAVASTVTYLERYTLLAITGMAAMEGDDDAQVGGQESLTPEQIAKLEELVAACGPKFNLSFFLKTMKAESLELLPAKRFKQASKVLEANRASH